MQCLSWQGLNREQTKLPSFRAHTRHVMTSGASRDLSQDVAAQLLVCEVPYGWPHSSRCGE